MPQIVRFATPSGTPGLGLSGPEGRLAGRLDAQHASLSHLLRLPRAELYAAIDAALARETTGDEAVNLLAPIDGDTEVWAAGVTYQRSEAARVEESDTPDIYSRVYRAERPELFFKATPRRVVGHGGSIRVRADSTWDVPEPELALVVNAHAEIVGYTIADDVSSRSIEGENPLYLPQAKVYAACCALGPGITPARDVPDPYALGIRLRIERGGGTIWEGETSTALLKRRLEELVDYLFREDAFPDGVVLCTGTALVPETPFTLRAGDVVSMQIDGLGTLTTPVAGG